MVETLKNIGLFKQISNLKSTTKIRSDYAFIIGAILATLFPLIIQDQYILHVMIIALMYSVLAVSWNFIVGYIGTFSLGHQAFFGIGGYVSALMTMKAGISPWLGILLGGSAAAFLSLLIGLPCLRLRAAPYIAIATLAFAEVARIICMNLVDLTRGELGLWGIPTFPKISLPMIGVISFEGGARIPYYYLILIILIITMVVFHFILNSHIGLAFKAIGDSQDASESIGINLTIYKLMAFVIGSFFAGVAGSFYAHYLLILTPTAVFSFAIMVDIIVMTLLGGISTFMGPVIGSIIVVFGLEYLRVLQDYRLIVYGMLLVILILFIPKGVGVKLFRDKTIVEHIRSLERRLRKNKNIKVSQKIEKQTTVVE